MNKEQQKISSAEMAKSVAAIEGISNAAVRVASVVQFHSIFSQQNRKYADISMESISYHNYLSILKQTLTSASKKILSRVHSGMTKKKQNKLEVQVKICRFLGLLPYVK